MDAMRMTNTRAIRRFVWLTFVALPLAAGVASADEGLPEFMVTEPNPEETVNAEQRPFAFLVDPSTPRAGNFVVGESLGFGSGITADRPIPVVLQHRGVSNDLSLGYGITPSLEGITNLNVNFDTSNGATTVNGILGAKLQLTHPASPWRVAALAGVLREGGSASWGAWARGAGSFTTGRLLIEANAYLEHVFAQGRDAVDYIGMLGTSYRVAPVLRVGAEFVGQDLEELSESGAEGGARMGVGPDIALDLDHGRIKIVVAALFGVTAASPEAIVRAGVFGSF